MPSGAGFGVWRAAPPGCLGGAPGAHFLMGTSSVISLRLPGPQQEAAPGRRHGVFHTNRLRPGEQRVRPEASLVSPVSPCPLWGSWERPSERAFLTLCGGVFWRRGMWGRGTDHTLKQVPIPVLVAGGHDDLSPCPVFQGFGLYIGTGSCFQNSGGTVRK